MSGLYDKMMQKSMQESQPTSPGEVQDEQPKTPYASPRPSHQAKDKNQDTTVSRHHDTTNDSMVSQYHDTNHGTITPSNHDTVIPLDEADLLEAVRRSVKQIGKEPATQRLTLEEKQALRSIEFTYGQQGISTSGNEIIRIATNYILQDYHKNGENSILAKVLKLLNF